MADTFSTRTQLVIAVVVKICHILPYTTYINDLFQISVPVTQFPYIPFSYLMVTTAVAADFNLNDRQNGRVLF